MRDYAELVKALRTCKLSIPCTECPFYSNGDEPSKECATMNVAAADAIEELLAENKAIKQSNKDDLFIATCNDSTGKDMTATFWTLLEETP